MKRIVVIVHIVWLELWKDLDAQPFRRIQAYGGMGSQNSIGVQFTTRQKLKSKKKKQY